jgi:hypothetical protein
MKRFFDNIKNKKYIFAAFFLILLLVPFFSSNAAPAIYESYTSDDPSMLASALAIIISWILQFFLVVGSQLVALGAFFVDIFLNYELYNSVLGTSATGDSTAVGVGWRTVRDFCNMFYVFFLLLIAFATITRSQAYSAKSLLPKIVISMILINFSMVIAKVVIDFGQVFLFGIASWMGTFSGPGGAGTGLSSIVDAFRNEDFGHDWGGLASLLFAVFYTFALGLLYIILAGFLAFRLIYFVFLIIVSPFAFFSMVLPSMRTYTSKWWHSLVTNAISGPIFIFFVYLSAVMARELTTFSHPFSTTGLGLAEWLTNNITMVIPNMIALAMLWMAIPATQAIGAAGSKQLIGGTMGMGKAAALVGFGAAAAYKIPKRGIYDPAYRRSEKFAGAVDDIKDRGRKVIGKVPVVGTGYQMQSEAKNQAAKQAEVDNRKKKYGGDLVSMDVNVLMKGDNVDKKLAVLAAAEQGKLGDENVQKTFSGLSGQFSQKDLRDLTMKNPLFATMTQEGRARLQSDNFSDETKNRIAVVEGTTLARNQKDEQIGRLKSEEIMKEKMDYIVSEGKMSKVQNLDNQLLAKVWLDAQTNSQMNSSIKSMNKTQKIALSKGATASAVNATGDEEVKYASAAVRSGARVDDALSKSQITEDRFNQKLDNLLTRMDSSGLSSWHPKDLESYGYKISKEKATQLINAREDITVNIIRDSAHAHHEDDLENHIKNKLIN